MLLRKEDLRRGERFYFRDKREVIPNDDGIYGTLHFSFTC